MKTLLVEQIVTILTLCVYLAGFMDLSKSTSNYPSKNVAYKNLTDSFHKRALAKNTVIMIIDGLRTDHLVNSNQNLMHFSRGLLKSGHGVGYVVHTETPTVTLPRIKSLLTGSIPGFMDVIFNFASKELTDENIVHFWKNSGRKVRFYGDDTWLRLFPDTFDRWKGVASFYVTDFTEVDNNVTEQLMTSLPNDTWDVMILHYLGLDHIGHIAGPSSELIPAKLKEMDDIVRLIYQELERKNETYLLLVCGDHGMSDGGGHGGASASEIMTSAMLVSNLFKTNLNTGNRLVHQVDLASTLAIMTGIRIPNKNIGVPLDPVFDNMPLDDRLIAEHELCLQLITNAMFYLSTVENDDMKASFHRVSEKHISLVHSCSEPTVCPHYETEGRKLSATYADLQRRACSVLAENKHSYDLFLITISVFAIFLVSVSVLMNEILINLRSQRERSSIPLFAIIIYLLLSSINYLIHGSVVRALILSASLTFGIVRARRVVSAVRPTTMLKPCAGNFLQLFIFSFVIIHPLSLLATSFVEEEHQVFYFLLSSLHCLFLAALIRPHYKKEPLARAGSGVVTYAYFIVPPFQSVSKFIGGKIFSNDYKLVNKFSQAGVAILSWAIFRNLRYYNATGDKWRHLMYFNNNLTELPESVKYWMCLAAYIFSVIIYSPLMALILVIGELISYASHSRLHYAYSFLTQFGPYPLIFLIFFSNLVTLTPVCRRIPLLKRRAKVATYSRVIFCFECFFALLFVALQKRENYLCTSISLVHCHLLLDILFRFSSTLGLSDAHTSIVVFWLADAHFFSHGNSNSLTTVRIAAGFVGVNFYSPVIHGLLIAVHTFGIKIIIYLHFIRLSLAYGKDQETCTKVLRWWWMMQLIVLNVYIFVVTIQRHHLFIWSVFAPKLLYEGCHIICLFVVTLLSYLAVRATRDVEQKIIS